MILATDFLPNSTQPSVKVVLRRAVSGEERKVFPYQSHSALSFCSADSSQNDSLFCFLMPVSASLCFFLPS